MVIEVKGFHSSLAALLIAATLFGCDSKSGKPPETSNPTPAASTTSNAATSDGPTSGTTEPAQTPGELLLTPTASETTAPVKPNPSIQPNLTEPSDETPETSASAEGVDRSSTTSLSENTSSLQPVDLAQSPSPYLRLAAKSPVKWVSYSDEAFAQAVQSDRPILIDIGNLSNHFCRLMSAQVYSDENIAQTLNEKFVCIKVDGDQQPDVQARYALAHRTIHNKEALYPLTVFALPDGTPFDVLSYVPLEGTEGQPSFGDVLKQVEELFSGRREDLQKQASLVTKSLEKLNEGDPSGSFDSAALAQLTSALGKMDNLPPDAAPATAMFLLHYASDTNNKSPLEKASNLLLEKFRSPTRDHVLGGYFQSNPDGTPRFHKILPVQAQLISANALAFAANKKTLHKEAVQEILRFSRDTLEAQGGGFYTSQDADTTPQDDGSYFTWTRDEILELAGDTAEARVFAQYLNAGSERTALRVTDRLQKAADANDLSYNAANAGLADIRVKLRDARMQQENVPFVNKAILTSWNAEMICAYLDAYRYLGDTEARDFALESADYLINHAVSEREGVARVIYKDQSSGYGYLEDNVKLAAALIQCFQVSGMREYLESAESLINYVEAKFLDADTGLYRDNLVAGPGLLTIKHFPIGDDTTLGSNAVAAQVWYELYQALSNDKYQERAKRIVDAAGALTGLEIPRAGTLGRAAALVVNGAPKVLIIGSPDDPSTANLREAALPVFRMGKLVEVITPEEAAQGPYPPAKDGKAIAYVCTSKNCAPPVKETSKLAEVIQKFGRGTGDQEPKAGDTGETLAANGESGPADDDQDVN